MKHEKQLQYDLNGLCVLDKQQNFPIVLDLKRTLKWMFVLMIKKYLSTIWLTYGVELLLFFIFRGETLKWYLGQPSEGLSLFYTSFE